MMFLSSIYIEDLELVDLEQEEPTISTQLLQMPNGGGMSFWLNPSYIPIDPTW
jgi:hypothetical protein